MRLRVRRGFRARMVAGIGMLMMTSAVVLAAVVNVDDETIFELDGNPQDGAATGDDWARYFPSGLPGGNAAAKFFGVDPAGTTIFTQGGSKDINGISQWRHTNGSVPDKDDIQNAYAAAYSVGGELIVYFGADRTANNGDANIGFWFLQSNVGLNAGGTFSGGHIDGDIFVVSGFTSGGQTSEIDVYRWNGDDATGSLELITSSIGDATCVSGPGGTKQACAIANTGPVLSPWSYTPKSGAAGTFPIASFFEGGINVNALLPPGADTPCFSTFIVETRSSTSVTAQLKDFVRGDFTLCAVSMTKACTNGRLTPDGTAFLYDVKGTVTNDGFGTLFDVTVTDTFPPGVTPSPRDYSVGNLAAGQTKCWPFNAAGDANGCPAAADSFNSGTSNGPTNNASVAAATSAGGPKTVTAVAVPAACPVVPTNPSLTVTKGCTTDLAAVNNLLAVQVTFSGTVCNTGDIPLTNVTVTNDQPGTVPASFNVGNLAVGACGVPYGIGTYFPSAGTPGPGRYQFSDQVTATGTPSIGTCGGPATCVATATATCPLCPAGSCSP